MPNPKVQVLIEVTLLSEDGFYSVSKFTPDLWEQQRDVALELAHREHAAARQVVKPDPFLHQRTSGE